MTQCSGQTKKGDRCRRDAADGSDFCSIHQDQAVRPPRRQSEEWDSDAVMKAAIGFGLIAAIFLFRFRR